MPRTRQHNTKKKKRTKEEASIDEDVEVKSQTSKRAKKTKKAVVSQLTAVKRMSSVHEGEQDRDQDVVMEEEEEEVQRVSKNTKRSKKGANGKGKNKGGVDGLAQVKRQSMVVAKEDEEEDDEEEPKQQQEGHEDETRSTRSRTKRNEKASSLAQVRRKSTIPEEREEDEEAQEDDDDEANNNDTAEKVAEAMEDKKEEVVMEEQQREEQEEEKNQEEQANKVEEVAKEEEEKQEANKDDEDAIAETTQVPAKVGGEENVKSPSSRVDTKSKELAQVQREEGIMFDQLRMLKRIDDCIDDEAVTTGNLTREPSAVEKMFKEYSKLRQTEAEFLLKESLAISKLKQEAHEDIIAQLKEELESLKELSKTTLETETNLRKEVGSLKESNAKLSSDLAKYMKDKPIEENKEHDNAQNEEDGTDKSTKTGNPKLEEIEKQVQLLRAQVGTYQMLTGLRLKTTENGSIECIVRNRIDRSAVKYVITESDNKAGDGATLCYKPVGNAKLLPKALRNTLEVDRTELPVLQSLINGTLFKTNDVQLG